MLTALVALTALAAPPLDFGVPAEVASLSAVDRCRVAVDPLWPRDGEAGTVEVARWSTSVSAVARWLAQGTQAPDTEDLWGFEAPRGVMPHVVPDGARLELLPGDGAVVWGRWPQELSAHCLLFVMPETGEGLVAVGERAGRRWKLRHPRALDVFQDGVALSERRAFRVGVPTKEEGNRPLLAGEHPLADALVELDMLHRPTAATWSTAARVVGARAWNSSHRRATRQMRKRLDEVKGAPMKGVVKALRQKGARVRALRDPTVERIEAQLHRGAVVVVTVRHLPGSRAATQVLLVGELPDGFVLLRPDSERAWVVRKARLAAMMVAEHPRAWAIQERKAAATEPGVRGIRSRASSRLQRDRRLQLALAALIAGLLAQFLYRRERGG